jgi:hypothetical protein
MKHTIPEIGRGYQPQPSNKDLMMGVLQTRANCLERAAIAREKEMEARLHNPSNGLAAHAWGLAAEQWDKCDAIAEKYQAELEGIR